MFADGAVDALMLPASVFNKRQLGIVPSSIFSLNGLVRLELDGTNTFLKFSNFSVCTPSLSHILNPCSTFA